MLMPSPVFNEVNSLEPLVEITNQHLNKYLEGGVCTQAAARQWRKNFQQEIANQESLATHWLSSCIHLDASILPTPEILSYWVDLHWLHRTQQSEEVMRLLLAIQRQAQLLQFGLDETQDIQHNILEDLQRDPAPVTDGLPDDQEEEGNRDFCHPPKEKGQNFLQLWDARLELPCPKWGYLAAALEVDADLWFPFCRKLADSLESAYEERKNTLLKPTQSEELYKKAVLSLRQLRCVSRNTFKLSNWLRVVKVTGLAEIILKWSDPTGIALWRAPFVMRLFRYHRFNVTLLVVLKTWTPSILPPTSPVTSPVTSPPPAQACPKSCDLKNGKGLAKAIFKEKGLIPFESLPSSVYFLLGESNFQNAWKSWLACVLQERQYQISSLLNSDGQLSRNIFRDLVQAIIEWDRRLKSGEDFKAGEPRVEVVVQRTAEYRKLKHELSPNQGGLLNIAERQSFTKPCNRCQHLPTEQQCVQTLPVSLQSEDSNHKVYLGCGVTVHPQDEVLQVRKSQGHSLPKPVYHPLEDLELRKIQCDEDVVARCGVQVFRIVDSKSQKLLDFWAYNAIPEKFRQKMLSHSEQFAQLKGLTRGKQFASYSQGKMVPQGERMPSGGAAGDCHRFYGTMGANDICSLECLFDNAEDSMILSSLARLLCHELYQEMEKLYSVGELLGEDCATLYYCSNYAAPLHVDDDAAPGLCATLAFKAEPMDYAFINMKYHMLFLPRQNSVWSFTGTDVHGTTLPSLSLKTHTGSRDGAPDPKGPKWIYSQHKAKPKKNAIAAERYQTALDAQRAIQTYWDSEE